MTRFVDVSFIASSSFVFASSTGLLSLGGNGLRRRNVMYLLTSSVN